MDTSVRSNPLQPASAVLASLGSPDEGVARARLRSYRTGFDPLDRVLEGGLHPHELVLLGGNPGVGKTIAALQWAREMAYNGAEVVYACYEHDQYVLLNRLLGMEIGMLAGPDDIEELTALRNALAHATAGRGDLRELVASRPLLRKAYDAFSGYADRLLLARASGTHTGVAELRQLLDGLGENRVLFVDYLQKVSVRPEPDHEAEKVTRIAEGLKEVALSEHLPVIAVVASDEEGLTSRRLRLHHLRGSTALAYEADVALILNDKTRAIAKAHLAYDAVKARDYKHWAICSVEKNRGGMAMLDLEFRKDFAHYRFDPEGGYVQERLVDENLDED